MVAQFNDDGSLDLTFNHSPLINDNQNYGYGYDIGNVYAIEVVKDDKILVTGDFQNHIWLLNNDGSLDSGFVGATDQPVYTATPQSDNKMIIAGEFSNYATSIRNSIARISWTPEIETLSVNENASADKKINLFPNPAVSELNVINLKPGSLLKVYNAIGQVVYSTIADNQLMTINVSNFLNGIYYLSSEKNGERANIKFIVEK
jgi:hypothetical protein